MSSQRSSRRFRLPGLTADQTSRYWTLLMFTVPAAFVIALFDLATFDSALTWYVGLAVYLGIGGWWMITGDFPWDAWEEDRD